MSRFTSSEYASTPINIGDLLENKFILPVYKYEKFTTLECELCIILGEDEVRINVYDYGTSDRYAPFYYCEYGNYDAILRIIWRNIDRQLNNLAIKEKDQKVAN